MKFTTKRNMFFYITLLICFFSFILNYFIEKEPMISTLLVLVSVIIFCISIGSDKVSGDALKNKMLWSFSGLITLFMFFGIYVERYFDTLYNISFVCLVFIFLSNMLCIGLTYIKNPSAENFKYFVLIIFEIEFIFATLTVESPWIMYVPLPLYVFYLLYRDKKVLLTVSCILGVVNIVAVCKFISKIDVMKDVMYRYCAYIVQACLFLLFTTAICITLRMNNNFVKERLSKIEGIKNKADDLTNEIIKIAKKVRDNAIDTNQIIEELEQATCNSLMVLQDIEQGNILKTKCVENQTEMTANISEMIESIKLESDLAVEISNTSLTGLKRGKKAFEKLKQKSNIIVEKNDQVISIINKFVENTKKVKVITNGIAEISEQTNLLALNASIESARASSTTKDFGVVASEIRGLADNTSTLTDNIDKIVMSLENNALKAQKVVNNVVESVNDENKTIDETLNDIIIMEQNINKLGNNVSLILDKIMNMTEFNTEIVNNIMQLSASSEEVIAYTDEALRINKNNINKANLTKNLMNDLLDVANQVDTLNLITK